MVAKIEDINEAMKDVVDPELGINVVDLGLIYDMMVDDNNIAVLNMTLTSAACPLQDVIEDLDLVLIMSVNPGFGGQSFIRQSIKKTQQLRAMIDASNSSALIEIDGGVNLETGAELLAAGADALVAGSFVFKSENPRQTIGLLKAL